MDLECDYTTIQLGPQICQITFNSF